MGIGAAN